MWRIGFLVWRAWIYLKLTSPALVGLWLIHRAQGFSTLWWVLAIFSLGTVVGLRFGLRDLARQGITAMGTGSAMMRDDLDDQAEWIAILASEHRTLLGPGRIPRAINIDRVLELAHQLAGLHEGMADLYRRHITVIAERLRIVEDDDD